MNIDIIKIFSAVIGAIGSFKLIFWLFNPTEMITITFIGVVILLAYGVQSTEWAEHDSFFIFGLNIYKAKKVYQQYRIWGIIPITKANIIEREYSILEDVDAIEVISSKTFLSLLPFGALKKTI